jgi:hypothetical protein
VETLQAVTLIMALTTQLYVYCWFGNELTQQVLWSAPLHLQCNSYTYVVVCCSMYRYTSLLQSAELRQAVWACGWVGAPIREQRALLFMMAAAEEFTLSAGGVIPASRHTIMQVLNQTYSFLMFLMNFIGN